MFDSVNENHLDQQDRFEKTLDDFMILWSFPWAVKWNKELALSAAWHVQDLSGCNVYHPNVINDKDQSYYMRQIASFLEHEMIVIYPE